MTLLTMANANPNLPQSFRDSAIATANYAIVVAQEAIANNTTEIVTTTPIPTIAPLVVGTPEPSPQPIPSPVPSPQPAPTPTPTPAPVPVVSKRIEVETTYINNRDPAYNEPYGTYLFKTSLINSAGKNLKEPITMSYKGIDYTRIAEDLSGRAAKDNWHHTFTIVPQATGTQSVTFTSGEATKTVEFNVY